MEKTVVIRTGVANIASVLAALRRIGLNPELSGNPDDVRTGDVVVLPGVGAFAAGMETLRTSGLDSALRERIARDRPTLTVCLGLQLLFEESEESPGAIGLGVFPGKVTRFSAAPKVPQLGWNRIKAESGCRALESGPVYFANSYCMKQVPDGALAARCEYGEQFVAAFEKGNLLACQFHPELSGELGQRILSNWVARAAEVTCAR